MRVKRFLGGLPFVLLVVALVASVRLGGPALGAALPATPAASPERKLPNVVDTGGPSDPWIPARNSVEWAPYSQGLPSAGNARAVAFGDADNDGRTDMYVGTLGAGIRVWTRPDGVTWNVMPGPGLPTTGDWYGLAAADFNHDGREDLVAASDGLGVRVYLQVIPGTWREAILVSSGSFYDVAVGDVNNDGHPDVVATNHAMGFGVQTFTNVRGQGTDWSTAHIPNVAGPFWGVALADFNNDGNLDVAAASDAVNGGVYVWSGNGSLGWSSADAGLPHASGSWRDVAVGDFNNDGKLDLAATSSSGVRAWQANGSGSWAAAAAGLPVSGSYLGLAAGDLDADGKLDLVAIKQDGIEPWRNAGGSWSALTRLGSADPWLGVALADVDGDGILDLGATSQSDRSVRVWVSSSTSEPIGNWLEIDPLVPATSSRALVAGDVNWDGNLDVVAAMGTDAGIRAWRGDGGNSWTSCSANLPSSGTYEALVLGQLSGDAYPELIAGSGNNAGIKAYLNTGCVWNAFGSGLPTTGSFDALALGDLDHDGKRALVAARSGGGLPMWRHTAGTWTSIDSPTATSTYADVALGDLNNDGEMDVAAANSAGLGVRVWLRGSVSPWSAAVVVPTGEYYAIALGDLNNDGKLDIVAAKNGSSGEQGIYVWLGDGTGTGWTPLASPAATGQHFDLDLADFNRDGFMDILAARDTHGVDVWAGNDAGGWTESSTNLPTTGAFFVSRFAHVDHDGTPDLVTAQFNGGIRVWTAAESTPPGGWIAFHPAPWVTSSQTVDSTVQVMDGGSGLKVGSAQYAYSTDAGQSWSDWKPAPMTGADGTTDFQTITAAAVSFGQDSLTTHRNRVKFRVADMKGNVGESGVYAVDIDTTPPTNPTSLSGDRATSAWSNDNTATMTWSGATDASSGVWGYSYQWSGVPWSVPGATVDTTGVAASTTIPGDGDIWYFHVRARDVAGNWASEATHHGPYWLDTLPPTNPDSIFSSPAINTWTKDNTINVSWSGAEDAGSGVSGYSYQWSTSPATVPNTIVDAAGATATSPALSDGSSHYFHVRARDAAGNWANGATHKGPFKIDRTAPSSAVTAPSGSVGSTTFTVTWSGSDAGSGLANYDVQYRDVTAGSAWTIWKNDTTQTSSLFIALGGHTYQFRARANDNVDNQEDWPVSYDTQVAVATEDFEVDHTGGLEVTQAIQDRNNSVVLIANKTTYVRFHVHSHSGDEIVTARLAGYRGGSFLGYLTPGNAGGTTTVKLLPNRGLLNDSFWFQLPSGWLHGTVTLQAELNHDHRLAETSYADNTATATVSFVAAPPMDLLLVEVPYTLGETTYRVRSLDRTALASWLRRAYPIGELNVRWTTLVPGYGVAPLAGIVNQDLMSIKIQNVLNNGESLFMRYYGMVSAVGAGSWFMQGEAPSTPAVVASGPAGISCCGNSAGWDPDGSYADWYGGHELGHAYGRKHTLCKGNEGGWDVLYPYPGGRISPTLGVDAATTVYGFDTKDRAIYPPSWTDIMSYCGDQWISPYTYLGIYNQMFAENLAAQAAQAAPQAVGEYLAVFGSVVTATDAVTLRNVYRVPDARDVLERVPGDYAIRLLDRDDAVLADYPFTPRESIDHTLHQAQDAGQQSAPITELVPWVDGTARIALFHGLTELISRAVSANPPSVTVTSPNGGESLTGPAATISWTARDPDGDALTFSLLYSTDGGARWQALGTNIVGTTTVISTSVLAGTDQGRIRIMATDGVNTAFDDSDANFSVSRKAPELHLVSPTGTATYALGQTVALEAEAYDVEDGLLGDAAFTWTSSLSGSLGTGRALAVVDLVTGTHAITVTVTDSHGQQASETATVRVGAETARIYIPIAIKDSGW